MPAFCREVFISGRIMSLVAFALGVIAERAQFGVERPLTSRMRNHMVTHYAKPNGYAFRRPGIRRSCRSHSPRGARSVAPGPPPGRRDCARFSNLASGGLKAPASAPRGRSRDRDARRAQSLLSAQPQASQAGRPLARALPKVLGLEVVKKGGRWTFECKPVPGMPQGPVGADAGRQGTRVRCGY